ncbi:hypothetical protein UFOVP138_8 [uncultured Caudovirales phage]|uniref:Uncharacterized protein n=1 Tax=uncultured Caudovirales phage TaxID=2100421 RepID=A0A6J5LCK7_9CAUD|nr:hypothetical protein UFOVP138_8 [uncultured Caudovirales phage]
MKIEFNSTVGDDIPVTVIGNYELPDNSVGYWGSFDIENIYLKCDVKRESDIQSLIPINSTWRRLESEGMRDGESVAQVKTRR